jgi:hypothetical protein
MHYTPEPLRVNGDNPRSPKDSLLTKAGYNRRLTGAWFFSLKKENQNMTNPLKWALALLFALSVIVVARASMQNEYYMPIVYKQAEPTDTLTPTVTTTLTPTPTLARPPHPDCNPHAHGDARGEHRHRRHRRRSAGAAGRVCADRK